MVIGQIPLLITCGFLFDAFRRLSRLEKYEVGLSKKTILSHAVAFGVYILASLVFTTIIILPNYTVLSIVLSNEGLLLM